jgi:hypothetical protein
VKVLQLRGTFAHATLIVPPLASILSSSAGFDQTNSE